MADERSYTRAAEKEFLTQPAIYAQVRQLEKEVGAKLVHVSGKEVLLTAVGREVYELAEAVLRAHQDFQRQIHRRHLALAYEVRIGATSLFGLAAAAAERFRAKSPDGVMQFQSMSPLNAIDAIHSGDIDFGFFGPEFLSEGLSSEECDDNRIVVVAPSGHPLARQQRASFAEIAQFPLVGYAGGSARAAVETWLRDHPGCEITYGAQADSSLAIKMLALTMGMPALIVEQVIREELQTGQLVVLDVPEFTASYPLYIVYDRLEELGPAALAFLEEIRTLGRERAVLLPLARWSS
jgi:DNA-binding transcriptional LysR family regulator